MTTSPSAGAAHTKLFWGCFLALIATSFGFIIRALIIGDWAADFDLNETQKGELLGVGLWPFAISIVLFSLVIDRIGYRNAMKFGLVCHLLSIGITIMAKDYWWLYIGTFIAALGNGTVEAYINPVVATIFNKNKTQWLNRLHAGWPGGLVLGGIIVLLIGNSTSWQFKVGLLILPVVLYAIMLWKQTFPVNERVAAGISYNDMLKEVGIVGALIISVLVFSEVSRIFNLGDVVKWGLVLATTGWFGYVTKSLGRPLFILMLLIMIPLAITELGVDSWISDLMAGAMKNVGIAGGWVLVYTSAIMMVLRFFAGPIVHKLSPLGLLATCAVIAASGLFYLSSATGVAILLAATLYGVGKSFFWPTTLGVVAEQFPKGGALTLNGVAAVGMLAAGIVGGPLLGYFQDTTVSKEIAVYDASQNTKLEETYVIKEKKSVFGKYMSVDGDKVAAAPEADKTPISTIQEGSKKSTLKTVAYFPILMLLCYIGLLLYFKSKGGYKPVEIG